MHHKSRSSAKRESPAGGTTGPDLGAGPIDGTANLVHGLPRYAVSLALVQDDCPLLGIIDVPMLEQHYWAVKGQGSLLNGEHISVSGGDRPADAMATLRGYAVGDNADRKNRLRLGVTAQLARQVLRVRILGSAAIGLAWLAEGETDACVILGNHP
jgi:myo-inositol-1(or 4)-monophosphatase